MDLYIDDRQTSLSFSHAGIKELVTAVLSLEEVVCDEVGVHLVEVEEICELHKEHFNDPSVTDCISFPMNNDFNLEGAIMLGDIFICPRVALDYAQLHKTDPYEEAALYIIHGLLHLIGYDDIEENDIKEMRSGESRHLENIKSKQIRLDVI